MVSDGRYDRRCSFNKFQFITTELTWTSGTSQRMY